CFTQALFCYEQFKEKIALKLLLLWPFSVDWTLFNFQFQVNEFKSNQSLDNTLPLRKYFFHRRYSYQNHYFSCFKELIASSTQYQYFNLLPRKERVDNLFSFSIRIRVDCELMPVLITKLSQVQLKKITNGMPLILIIALVDPDG